MSKTLAVPPIRSRLRPISGNSGLPGIGQTLKYIRDSLELMQKRWDRYGEVSWFSTAKSTYDNDALCNMPSPDRVSKRPWTC